MSEFIKVFMITELFYTVIAIIYFIIQYFFDKKNVINYWEVIGEVQLVIIGAFVLLILLLPIINMIIKWKI